MIQANELRIGNLVEWSRQHDICASPEIVQVYNISLSSIRAYTDIDELPEILIYYDDIKPIPLTPEWLTRAGFVKEFDDVYSIGLPTGDGVDLLLEWGDCSLRRNHVGKEKKKGDKNPYDYAYIKSPKYVHQLQQLYFSLSGKELEFK